MRRAGVQLVLGVAFAAAALVTLGTRATGLPPFGTLLDPLDGLYRTARLADAPPPEYIEIPGLEESVLIEWDDRGVPHIYAQNDLDAVRAIGFATARDRLFQLDFLPRAASGRLAEALGRDALPADRFLRSTGMDWGARKNLDRILDEGGIELQMLDAYADGVNAFMGALEERDLPFEFRLLGYEPDAWTPIRTLHLLQYMMYDLTYGTDRPSYGRLRENLSQEDYDLLYPLYATPYVPIIPPEALSADGAATSGDSGTAGSVGSSRDQANPSDAVDRSGAELRRYANRTNVAKERSDLSAPALKNGLLATLLEGYIPGKGSNNWAVGPERSSTGRPILAGDMHLAVTLPSIWYEVHVVTPSMNSYGVTIPGAPLPIEAFNDHVAWAFTNTGADQVDHYRVDVDDSVTRFRYEGKWEQLRLTADTIRVKGEEPVVDTLRYAPWGPVLQFEDFHYVLRWTAHQHTRTLRALLAMNSARNQNDFELGLRYWDSPMQNILYADINGVISIRSAGRLPVRRGESGAGLLDGSSGASDWIGHVPFDELPSALNPPQDFLTSANQQPTTESYPYYIGHDWADQYRSLRIDSLLRSRPVHTPEQISEYQADVHAVQYDLFFPLIDTISGLTPRADSLRKMLRAWDGMMSVDRTEPLVLDVFLTELEQMAWDETVFFENSPAEGDRAFDRRPVGPLPQQSRLYILLREHPDSPWLDIRDTATREDAAALLRAALDAAAERVVREFGPRASEWRWGPHRKIYFGHLIDSPALRTLGRGPFEVSGYRETLSPAAAPITTHSASWRVVVEFVEDGPRGRGVYPGGQSGNPFARRYDLHVPRYLDFDHYDLLKPDAAGELVESHLAGRTVIQPLSLAD